MGIEYSENDVEYFRLDPDHQPRHPVCLKTFKLTDKDQVFCSHKDLKKLDTCDRKNDILNTICDEYLAFDKRGL